MPPKRAASKETQAERPRRSSSATQTGRPSTSVAEEYGLRKASRAPIAITAELPINPHGDCRGWPVLREVCRAIEE